MVLKPRTTSHRGLTTKRLLTFWYPSSAKKQRASAAKLEMSPTIRFTLGETHDY